MNQYFSKAKTIRDIDALVFAYILGRKKAEMRTEFVDRFAKYKFEGGKDSLDAYSGADKVEVGDEEVSLFKLEHYAELRSALYPPVEDLADALVKNDAKQLAAYKERCLAVKKELPKP